MDRPAEQIELVTSKPPTTEIGQQVSYVNRIPGLGGLSVPWAAFMDEREYAPDLVWPNSIRVFDMMRTDSQLKALHYAVTMPIRRYKWMIDPNGAPEEAVMGVANDLNLDIKGREPRPKGRQKKRFSHDKHLFHALLALIYGHYYFEQVGKIDPDGFWHLTKLPPRIPQHIGQIIVAADGGLIGIRQTIGQMSLSKNVVGGSLFGPPLIPVDRLAAFIWDQEGANWIGRSLFRDCYKNWLIKDRLLRIDAINHERAGGVPWAEAPPGATPAELDRLSRMAQQFKVGEDSGGAVPAGGSLNIAKAGSGTDVVGSIRYHDESMARAYLAMFIQLGQTTTGSRALGESFIDYFVMAQLAVANWYRDIMNEHIIEDWVDWNLGEQVENVPLLDYVVEESNEYLTAKDLALLVAQGVIVVDPELEDVIRNRFSLPDRDPNFVPPAKPTLNDPVANDLATSVVLSRYVQGQLALLEGQT